MEITTRYEPDPTEKIPTGDAAWIKEGWLEETHLRLDKATLRQIRDADPDALRDSDGDGYWEVPENLLDQITGNPARPLPLATYFEERGECSSGAKRLEGLSAKLWVATKRHDFAAARDYFTGKAKGAESPLKRVKKRLSRHLGATASHMRGNVAESATLDGPSGFSVRYDGRLRFDCVLFAQLAHSDLQGIPGLKFHYLILISATPPPNRINHVLLLVSDLKHPGKHLLVDSGAVTYLESGDIWAEIRSLYSGYVKFKRGDTVDGKMIHF
ncbi:MAG: hypothetical protein HYY44_06575 [Deltaproteobacteria bacterium]|nr:hypothetical protein [Deltaproteobacteria bacterium]MBI4373661.1 hypothetical protein [Deltaproteobacteria bacterium]